MVPESSVSNSLNASRISSSWSLVNEGVDIGLAVPATTPTHAGLLSLFGNCMGVT